jgi:hypothetical protein
MAEYERELPLLLFPPATNPCRSCDARFRMIQAIPLGDKAVAPETPEIPIPHRRKLAANAIIEI